MAKNFSHMATGIDVAEHARKVSIKAMSKNIPGPNIVDEFLSAIEPAGRTVIRSSSRIDDLGPKHVRTRYAYQLHTSNHWHMFINTIIALNGIQIGLSAEITGNTAGDAWQVCDYIFTVIFAVEMIVALVALRLQYFLSPWNYLDFAVANIAIIDAFLPLFMDGGDTGGLSTFRVFRLLKLLRLAKMIKVIPELMMVIQGLFASMRAMFWVFLLLVLVLYTSGIFCKEMIGSSDAGYPAFSKQVGEEQVVAQFNNYLYFGSIARSMTTLFNMVILAEWQEVLRPVLEHQPAMVFFFILVIFICSFGVLNVLIGVVVEHTMDAMRQQREQHLLELQKSQFTLASTLADMVFNFDVNNDDSLSQEELMHPDHIEELHAILGSLGLPHGYSLEELFVMLDVDGNGCLSKLEFVQGIMRLIYCDQFQRDCLFRTSIGQVKHAVFKSQEQLRHSQEQLRQTFEQQLQETCTRFISVVKQLHQRESCAPLGMNEFTVDTVDEVESAPATGHADFFSPEDSPESKADISKVVDLRVVNAEQLNLSGPWNSLVSPETFCLEAAEVSILHGQSGRSAPSICIDTQTVQDVEYTNRDARVMGGLSHSRHQKQVTWNALQKSLLPVHRTEDGFALDARAAAEMVCILSRSHEVMGWMPVINRRLVKDSL